MRRVRVKICGNTRLQDIKYAAQAGADALGFIVGFQTSPRNLTLDHAYELMKSVPPFIDRVVVTRDDPKVLRKIAERLPADGLQLIGEAPYSQRLREIFRGVTLIKVVHADPKYMISRASEVAKNYDAILVDSAAEGIQGGTGRVHDWMFSRMVAEAVKPKPTILAGGLTPENVEEAVNAVRPYAVDVSSGVESKPGLKDPVKIRMFIENAKMVML